MAWWIFQNVVITAALAAAVAIVCRFGRIGPVARHALWVLVLVKFVTPPIVTWPWGAPDPLGIARIDNRAPETTTQSAIVLRESAEGVVAGSVAPVPEPAVVAEPGTPNQTPEPGTRRPPPGSQVSLSQSLLVIWIVGSVGVLAVQIVRLVRLARRVRHALPPDPAIEQRVRKLASDLGVASLPVVTLQGSTSPVVWCLGRPLLLWPAELGHHSDACIDGLIVHELAHIRRRDHVVGWIELVAGVMWWWNPLFWSVRSALREQAELACDAWVISALPNGRRAYAESLLALSSLGAAPASPVAAVVGVRASSRRALERRLVMIMKGRASLRLPWAGIITLALLAGATLPAWAVASDDRHHSSADQAAQAKPAQQSKPAPTAKPVESQKPKVVTPKEGLHVYTFTNKDGKQATYHLSKPLPHVLLEGNAKAWTFGEQGQFFSADKVHWFGGAKLTEDAQRLVEKFGAEREAIMKAATEKVEAEHEAIVKDLQALQDKYAKEGKLDEAVAIRDFLKAGGPGKHYFTWIKR